MMIREFTGDFMLELVEINSKLKPKATVIWLHGLGADGHDFADIVPELNLPEELAVRFVFPHAPMRSITMLQQSKLRAWFDVASLEGNTTEDAVGIKHSQQQIDELIRAEIASGIPSERIVIAGFSQGGAMSLQVGLRFSRKLAGILVLSAWLPLAATVAKERNVQNQTTPIMMLHGTNDALIPLCWAKDSCEQIARLGYQVKFNSYSMQHEVCVKELADIGAWLQRVLI